MSKITRIWAREILDSRGIPTVETACKIDSGHIAVSSVPSGTSVGSHEDLELRDQDPQRYHGQGVLKAVENVNNVLGPLVSGMDPQDQSGIDQKMLDLDRTENESRYGANAILSVSQAVTKAAAISVSQPLYAWVYSLSLKEGIKASPKLPTPLFNMINGGKHGAGNLDFQEFQVIPASSKKFSEGLQMGSEIYHTIGSNLERRGAIHSVGLEGGYAPNLFTNADALQVFIEAIKQTKYSMGRDAFLGLDIAADSFFKDGVYTIKDKSSPLNDDELLEYYKGINDQYRLAILEDAFAEDAWDSWKKLYSTFGDQLTVLGDDLLATNTKRIEKALSVGACNGVLVKPNQAGTISETIRVVKMAQETRWKVIVSHRSGETNDSFIADFAVGVGADYVKFGAPARGERVAKYNRLLAIEQELSRLSK